MGPYWSDWGSWFVFYFDTALTLPSECVSLSSAGLRSYSSS